MENANAEELFSIHHDNHVINIVNISQETLLDDNSNNIKIKFFVTTTIHHSLSFPPQCSSIMRTYAILNERLSLLNKILEHISQTDTHIDGLVKVLICPEDFFQGGELYDKDSDGTCLDRDITYAFFATQMRVLSKKYFNVLLIPGSAYVSIPVHPIDESTYKQNEYNITKPILYVQNIAPIFWNGNWIRLIKKGEYLVKKASKKSPKKSIISAEEHQKTIGKNVKFDVSYGEDELADLHLAFVGLTPLAGEEACLKIAGIKDILEFHHPVFSIQTKDNQTIVIGLEICRDHNVLRKLENLLGKEVTLDCHIIVTNGTPFVRTLAINGYSVRSDEESVQIYHCKDKIAQYVADEYSPSILCQTTSLPLTPKQQQFSYTSNDLLINCSNLLADIYSNESDKPRTQKPPKGAEDQQDYQDYLNKLYTYMALGDTLTYQAQREIEMLHKELLQIRSSMTQEKENLPKLSNTVDLSGYPQLIKNLYQKDPSSITLLQIPSISIDNLQLLQANLELHENSAPVVANSKGPGVFQNFNNNTTTLVDQGNLKITIEELDELEENEPHTQSFHE